MAGNEVLVERRGGVLVLTLNRPDIANAMTLDMANQLFNIVKTVTTDRSVHCVLLMGAGEHLMDGIDMSLFKGDFGAASEQMNKTILPYHSIIREFRGMDKPVLVSAKGRVTGSGFSLMVASDLVISSDTAVFNSKYVNFGLSPDGGCSYFLPRRIGAAKAIELLMLGEDFTAETAQRLDLVNKVVPESDIDAAAYEMAAHLAEGPTRSYGAIKKLVMHSFEQNLNGQLGLEHNYLGQNVRSFDFRDAIKAFFAGKPVKFTGS